jgi:hypothetical protein
MRPYCISILQNYTNISVVWKFFVLAIPFSNIYSYVFTTILFSDEVMCRSVCACLHVRVCVCVCVCVCACGRLAHLHNMLVFWV